LLIVLATTPALAAEPDHEVHVARVLAALGADRPDVRACLGRQVASEPERRAEVARLGDTIDWIERAVTVPRHSAAPAVIAGAEARFEAFADIVATFIHERRLDGARLAVLTEGQLTPRHISTWARVKRALGSGHDPRRVMCGL
jgi:hypothetical protein